MAMDEKNYSEEYIREQIRLCKGWMGYAKEPWKSRMWKVYNDWKAGKISSWTCWNRISALSDAQIKDSVRKSKKNKKKDEEWHPFGL